MEKGKVLGDGKMNKKVIVLSNNFLSFSLGTCRKQVDIVLDCKKINGFFP